MPEDVAMPAVEQEAEKKEDAAKADGEKLEDAEAQKEDEKPAEPEEAKELEQDDPADKRPKLEATVAMNTASSTLNVVPTCGGKVLMALNDGGFQYFTAAARATAGVKSGRYLFEVRIAEKRYPAERLQQKADPGCKLGFSTAGASLFIGESDPETVGFDSDGNFLSGKNRTSVGSQFVPFSEVYGVLLNLDQKSPNANTVSLFRDGVRVCKPQQLPESMVGKVLYPTINYRSMTLHLNFGPTAWHPLPFNCTMIQAAAKADIEIVAQTKPKDGKHEVLFPVGLPDEGTFEWLDGFLKENPNYTEISTRANLEWGLNSGLYRKHGSWRACNDEPSLEFGIRDIDGYTLPQMIQAVTPLQKRNYVAMEVKKNLLKETRTRLLAQFNSKLYKRVAVVVMGVPPAAFKAKVHEKLLASKRQKVAEEVKRARQIADRKKKTEASKKRAELARQKREKEKDADEEKKEGDEKEEPEKAEDQPEAKEAEPEADEMSLEDEIKKAEAAVELTEQEKRISFSKPETEDLNSKDFSRLFSTFTIPDETEDFDEIRYMWQNGPACAEYLKKWISERKLTQRVEDLNPGSWFGDQLREWNALVSEWRKRHSDWKDPSRRKYILKSKRDEKKKQKKDEDAAAHDAEDKKAPIENGDKKENGDEPKEEKKVVSIDDDDADKEKVVDIEEDAEKGAESKEAAGDTKADKDDDEDNMEGDLDIKVADLDVFSVKDVCDVGTGEPLFANFTWEDWMAMTLRFEMHLLAHSYRRDLDDEERAAFHEQHLGFYYKKYFKKELSFKNYGVDTTPELLALIKDTMEIAPKNSVLDPQLADDTPFENFLKLTEDQRRERNRMLDAGDETVALKFQKSHGSSYHAVGGSRYGGSTSASYSRGAAAPASRDSSSRYGPPPTPVGSRGSSRTDSGGYSRPSSTAPPSGRSAPSFTPAAPGRGAPPPASSRGPSYGAPPSSTRYAATPPSRGAPPPSRSSGGYPSAPTSARDAPRIGEKRSYPAPPTSSHGGDRRGDRDKAPRTSAPPASRGGSYGGGSYGVSRR